MENILTAYSTIFKGFVSLDGLLDFDIRIPSKITKQTTWIDFINLPKHIRNISNKKKQALYYKMRGYSFDSVQSREDLTSNNACYYKYWTNRNFEHNYAMLLARNAWGDWSIKPPTEMAGILCMSDAKSSDYWRLRGHSDENCKIKSAMVLSKNRSCRTIQYWIEKGFDEIGAKQKVSEFQSMSSKLCLEASRKNGTMSLRTTTTIDYWLSKGHTLEEATILRSERQTTFSLEKCIEKYGEEAGTARWKQRQDDWQETLNSKPKHVLDEINSRKGSGTLEWALKKTDGNVELANIMLAELAQKRNSCTIEWALKKTNGDEDAARELLYERIKKIWINRPDTSFSKESIIALSPIIDYVHELCPEMKPYWKENEFYLNIKGKHYFYDLTFRELSVIIEYHGIFWHPRKGDYEWSNCFGLTYENKFPLDEMKKEFAISRGFDYIEIWSDEKIDYQQIFGMLNEKIKNYSKKSVQVVGD